MARHRDLLRALDLKHVWHPYTQMRDLAKDDFPIIASARGGKLTDVDGRSWWDATSSMWLNVHGHRVPKLDAALRRQLSKVAHTTLLGQSHEGAIRLATRLAGHARLPRVFFSDNGSTAVEAALKIALQYWALEGRPDKRGIASFDGAYHGDTLGAIAAAPVPEFHHAFEKVMGAPPVRLPWPDTTRGPHPGDPDATREWALEEAQRIVAKERSRLAAVIVEPLLQFVGGLRIMPRGYLAGLRRLCTENEVLLILDEVATGFGRTAAMFAGDHEGVRGDLLALGKGLTGGYLPVAATLATNRVYEPFLGRYEDLRAFYHGHSFSGNPLGCAVALASLDLLERRLPRLPALALHVARTVDGWDDIPYVGEVRHLGLAAGFDLVTERKGMQAFPWASRAGWVVHLEARQRGLLARPYASTALFVPPLSSTRGELSEMLALYREALVAAGPALRARAARSWPTIHEVPQ
ncbi:MAG: adenosylmethionine--8-amino-7-oxononanoate transaminase [Thermoplasmatota archaeon]